MDANLATVLETVGDVLGDQPAVAHGTTVTTWAELDDRAARLASHLADRGIAHGSRVAIGLRNSCEYVTTVLAVLKIRATPLNVNYRYKLPELRHVIDDSGAQAIVFDHGLAGQVAGLVESATTVRALVQVGGDEVVDGAVWFDDAVRDASPAPRTARGDDEWLLYTGGTTGRPKGVLARHSWVYRICVQSSFRLLGEPPPESLSELAALTAERVGTDRELVCMPAAPLMHGVGIYNTIATLQGGGTVVFTASRSFDAAEAIDLVDLHGITDLAIVGDAFAGPLADELDARAARGEPASLDSLRRVRSVGAMWSAGLKRRLLQHGRFTCQDMISASEGGPFAISVVGPDDELATGRFRLAPAARLLDADGRDVEPGSDVLGILAAPTDAHIRYLGDDEKTRQTFRTIDGVRYCVPGDMALLEADGTLVLKGRGSGVINTGGEKVHAEEVEHVLLEHPGIREAVVVGVPDPVWGQRVAAVIATRSGAPLDEAAVRDWIGTHLAGFKRPKDVVFVPALHRSPAGKADLRWAEAQVRQAGGPAPADHAHEER